MLAITQEQKQAVTEILNPESPTNLVIFQYLTGSTHHLETCENSELGLEKFLSLTTPENILYGLIGFHMQDGVKKIVYVAWCGPKAPKNISQYFSSHSSDLGRFAFRSVNHKVITSDPTLLTEEKLKEALNKSGSKLAPPRRALMRHKTAPLNQSIESKESQIKRARQRMTMDKQQAAEQKKARLLAEIAVAQKALRAKLQEKVEKHKNLNSKLTPKQVGQAIELFEECDVNGDGILDMKEFLMLKDSLAPKISRNFWSKLANFYFEKSDADKSGGIKLPRFIGAYDEMFCIERKETAALLLKVIPDLGLSLPEIEKGLAEFEKCDIDKNGVIDMDEYYQLKEQIFGPEMSKVTLRGVVEQEFQKINTEQTGEICEEEFLRSMSLVLSKQIPEDLPQQDPVTKFKKFSDCETLEGTIILFQELKELCGVAKDEDPYAKIREATLSDTRAKVLWSLLDTEKARPDYAAPWVQKKAKILVVGAGPAGLRAAINYAMLGAKVDVIEMKRTFSRHNLLHIWDSTIRDLKSIGAKFFFGQFCSGGINHVSIRDVQLLLLKIALINGVNVVTQVAFRGIANDVSKDPATGLTLWHAQIDTRRPGTPPFFHFNVLVGADGAHSSIISNNGFDVKILQGGEAIGITCNFKNGKTQAESHLREFGLLSVYEQVFFRKLKDQFQVELENLVYYRGETHYMVMTAKRASLLARGVMRLSYPEKEDFLKRSNVDPRQLEAFCRSVATYIGLPEDVDFELNSRNMLDVAIFDFSAKRQSSEPLKFVKAGGSSDDLLVMCVGDAVIEPFWPLGTGANRAVLGAADSAWTLRHYFDDARGSNEQIKEEAQQWYKILMCSSPDDLQQNFNSHSLNPATRYKKAI